MSSVRAEEQMLTFVLLVTTFKNKGPYWVELHLMQIFELFKTLKLGNVPSFV